MLFFKHCKVGWSNLYVFWSRFMFSNTRPLPIFEEKKTINRFTHMITILFMFESLEHEVFFKAINGMLLKSLIMNFLAT